MGSVYFTKAEAEEAQREHRFFLIADMCSQDLHTVVLLAFLLKAETDQDILREAKSLREGCLGMAADAFIPEKPGMIIDLAGGRLFEFCANRCEED